MEQNTHGHARAHARTHTHTHTHTHARTLMLDNEWSCLRRPDKRHANLVQVCKHDVSGGEHVPIQTVVERC